MCANSLAYKFISFAGVGAIGTTAHYIVYVSLVSLIDGDIVISSSLGFLTGAVINYYLNYIYTFRSSKEHSEAIIKFFIIAFIGLILNSTIILFASSLLDLHYLVSQIIATTFVLIWNFLGNHFWTFN
jgi:putative flippase GtrA